MSDYENMIKTVWNDKNGYAVFSTLGENEFPNSIYVGCITLYDEKTIIIADNYFNKTRKNIKSGSKGSLLFLTNQRKSYQLKGTISYHTSGIYFDEMKKINPAQHPGHAAAVITITEAYSGGEKIL